MVSIEQTIREVQELHTNCTHRVMHTKTELIAHALSC